MTTRPRRSKKAEARRDKVKPEIFQKVVADYSAARDKSKARLDELDAQIENVTADIAGAEARLEEMDREEEESAKQREREEAERAAREEEEKRQAEEEARQRAEEEQKRREEEERRAETERAELYELLATLDEERASLETELAPARDAMEELEFRKEMEEFESDEDYEAAAAEPREKLAALEGRLADIEKESADIRALLTGETPVPAEPESEAEPEPEPEPEEESAPEPEAEAEPEPDPEDEPEEEPAPAEDASEWEEVTAASETSGPTDGQASAAAVVAEEVVETAADPRSIEVDEEEVVEGDDWSDMEKEFFQESPDDRFFVNPCLILQDPSGEEKVFDLIHEIMSIGSGGIGEVDILVAHKSVDRKHARIKLEHGRYTIKDLGSKNGTFVNGKRVKKERLNHLDKVKVGDVFFQIRLM
ncbi:MAG: FHA domain-containing protein [Deltaproteobacteria bacterium]|nr:FHA domain-containing protein [Deltaproteobacteria bacterium]